eukprot:CAMPEP_0206513840 /NCGR_PEP_ID=MMETSP0324_2-20121206/61759_1 /ASSEMBLY_ACC=CAM_ASM_000836 /TAXON_ID=2866 /ORGANISM="Crypthecodinium cohnii, Strain Seligo" /LENGTH=46 /DNA_ID= /DNA_START= /DNA_END= /DNA_ORIENTATION=
MVGGNRHELRLGLRKGHRGTGRQEECSRRARGGTQAEQFKPICWKG